MEEPEEQNTIEFDSDEKFLIDSLALTYDKEKDKIIIDALGMKKAIERIRNSDQEFLSLTDQKRGLEVKGATHTLSFPELQSHIHQSLKEMKKVED